MIKALELENFGPFRGRHRIVLRPTAYAVHATFEADEERSNGAGKSMVLEAIDFVLYGRLKKERRFRADDWITKGEASGAVTLELTDGFACSRERRRGQATQVRTSTGASQAAAEEAIVEHLRITDAEFKTSAYFEQKAMAQFVNGDPADRLRIVRRWFDLDEADAAEKRASTESLAIYKELRRYKAERDVLRLRIANADITSASASIRAELEEAEAKEKAALSAVDHAKERESRYAVIERYDRLVERGKALRAETESFTIDVEAEVAAAEAQLATLSADHARAASDLESRRRIASGEFDGQCPIAAIQCPARKEINADRSASGRALETARRAATMASQDVAKARAELAPLLERRTAYGVAKRSLEAAREEERSRRPEVDRAKELIADEHLSQIRVLTLEELEERAAIARTNAGAVRKALADAEANERRRAEDEKALAKVEDAIAENERHARIASTSRTVLRTAARRYAESRLDAIGGRANGFLRRSGIDLGVEARWERESGDWAKTCEECGSPFPSSAKAKTCEDCGSPRGRAVVQRLDIVQTDQSGALDDLAGITLQIAAATFIVEKRQSPWSTLLVDEPTASCDRTNRRALAIELARLLSAGTGFRQALVLSHSPDVAEVFPNVIEIVVKRDGTRAITAT